MRTGYFDVASFTAAGLLHRWEGTEGQDSTLVQSTHELLGVAVCDGLGSRPLSKVGSTVLSHALARLLRDNAEGLREQSTLRSTPNFGALVCAWLGQELVTELAIAASFLAPGNNSAESQGHLNRYLYTTLLGALITRDHAVVFGCGDGVVCVNGETFRVSSDQHNRPDIIAARLIQSTDTAAGELRLLWCGPTTAIDSLLIGTDGAAEVLAPAVSLHELTVPSRARLLHERSVATTKHTTRPRDDASLVIVQRKISHTHSS